MASLPVASLKSLVAATLIGAAALALPGCYKAEAEANRTKAEQFESENKTLKAELDRVKTDYQTVMRRAQGAESQLNNAVLVTMVDGQEIGRDTIKWDGARFVRSGPRTRSNGTVNFEAGRVADGPLAVNRDSGKIWFKGQTRNSRPDGEWVWFDRDGKEQTKEVWTDGKLAELHRASIAKNGKVTWAKLGKADRDAWFKTTANTFVNLPELVRDTAAPANTVQAQKPATPTKSSAKKSTSQASADQR